MIRIALVTMMAAVLCQHLGLSEAVAGVAKKVAGCGKCFSFWVTLIVLLACRFDILPSVALAVLMSYLSHWFGLVLVTFNRLYDGLWQRLSNK